MDMPRPIKFALRALVVAIVGALMGFLASQLRAGAQSPAPQSRAGEIVGQATVVDGDTIEIQGKRIRLYGIDAPESDQWCENATARRFPCGRRVAFDLADLIGRQTVSCQTTGSSSYERLIARCSIIGKAPLDLSRWMVETGRAVAYRRYAKDYIDAETAARDARRGLWSGRFEMPEDHRRMKRGQ